MSETPAMDHEIHDTGQGRQEAGEDETVAQGLVANKSEGRTPGEMLREARLAREYSMDELCRQTMLPRHTIEVLEDDQYDQLSQPVCARGYFRKCAKVLGMDMDELMAAYAATGGVGHVHKPEAITPINIVAPEITPERKGRSFGTLLLVLILLAVAFGIYLFWSNMAGQSSVGESQTAGISLATELGSTGGVAGTAEAGAGASTSGDGALETAAGHSSGAVSLAAMLSQKNQSGNGQSATGSGGESKQAAAGSGAQQAAGAGTDGQAAGNGESSSQTASGSAAGEADSAQTAEGSAQAAAAGSTALTLKFDERSWVDVHDATGERLLVGIYEDTTRTLEGEPPYKIVIGYAPGVEVLYSGESVEFEVAENNTARFTVGAGG